MMGLEFYNTVMGRQFICSDFPRLVEALEKIAKNGEKVNAATAAASSSNKVTMEFAGFPIIISKAECVEDGEPYEEISLSFGDTSGNEIHTFAFFRYRPNEPYGVEAYLSKCSDGFDAELCGILPIVIGGEK